MSEKPVASIKTLARYEPETVYIGTGEYVAECVRADDGDYYLAADVDAEIERLRAERDALADALEAAREDAERWRHARRILTVEDIESSQDMFDAFGVEGDEHENRKVDAAIDQARGKGVADA